jgi:hypothetical protein
MSAVSKVCRVPAGKILGYRAFKDHLYLLEKIERNGAERQALVNCLALAATESENRDWWRKVIRNRIAALRSLSRRLETVSHDATKLLEDPFCRVGVWSAFVLGNPPATDPTKKSPIASFELSVLRSLAEGTAGQAQVLGRFLRGAERKYENSRAGSGSWSFPSQG